MSAEKSESTLSAGVSRLVRSLSKNPTKTADTPPSPSRTPSATSVTQPATKSTNAPRIPQQKVTAFERFTQLGKKKDKKPEFPPASWFEAQTKNSVTADADTAVPLPRTPDPDDDKKELAGDGDATAGQDGKSKEENDMTPDEVERPPEPTSLARKIQDLISALPVLSAYSSNSSLSSTQSTITPTHPGDLPSLDDSPADNLKNADGPPPMPPPPAPITDSNLISLLSSATIMNGSLSKGRQSVWSVLDRLRSPTSKDSAKVPGGHRAEQEEEDDDDDDSSVMMYAPLQPDNNSEVEVARSEICSVDEDGEVISERPGPDMNKPDVSQDRKDKGWTDVEGKGKGKAKEETKKVKEVRVWVPSTEKISVQAMWWGYRLYLPPPVLDVLSSKQLEAAKRAAMITTALKWLLDRIPVKVFPPQFRPILMMLKRLAPYLGYIGVFIAWSWGAIKAFDKGNGVILTATWLLPVALIPGTWDDDVLHPPTPPPKDDNNPSESRKPAKTNIDIEKQPTNSRNHHKNSKDHKKPANSPKKSDK